MRATPVAANHLLEIGVHGAGAHRLAQVDTVRCEQARIELAFGGEPGAGAVAAERLGDRGDESDLARAVVEAPALGNLAAVIFRDRVNRPARLDARDELARRNHHVGAPGIAVTDVHELDEAYDHRHPAEALDEVEHGMIVDPPLDHRVDLDRREPGGDRGIDAVQHLLERGEAAAHAGKYFLVDGVQAHRHALQTVGLQVDGMPGQEHAVGGEGDVLDLRDAGKVAHQIGEICAQ